MNEVYSHYKTYLTNSGHLTYALATVRREGLTKATGDHVDVKLFKYGTKNRRFLDDDWYDKFNSLQHCRTDTEEGSTELIGVDIEQRLIQHFFSHRHESRPLVTVVHTAVVCTVPHSTILAVVSFPEDVEGGGWSTHHVYFNPQGEGADKKKLLHDVPGTPLSWYEGTLVAAANVECETSDVAVPVSERAALLDQAGRTPLYVLPYSIQRDAVSCAAYTACFLQKLVRFVAQRQRFVTGSGLEGPVVAGLPPRLVEVAARTTSHDASIREFMSAVAMDEVVTHNEARALVAACSVELANIGISAD